MIKESEAQLLGMGVVRALLLALAGVALTAGGILLLCPREQWGHLLVYDVPIAVPFVLFLLERWSAWGPDAGTRRALDLGVVGVALLRPATLAFWGHPLPPYVSGHALFLSFAIVTARSRTLRIAAALVMLQVIYMKVALWADMSVVGGAALGLVSGVAWRRIDAKRPPSRGSDEASDPA